MENSYKKGIIIAFGEMFLKSKGVKDIFQRKLINNFCFYLKKNSMDFKIISLRDRVFVKTENTKKALKIIKNIPGISWFSECFYFSKTDLKEFVLFIKENYQGWIKDKETFSLRVKIQDGAIKEKKEIIIRKIAEVINRKVDLSNPKKEIVIEIKKQGWFLYFKKIKGAGGLPLLSGGKAIVLMSGGIDSPVAAHSTLKRGVENIWVHFHSFPLVSNSSISKIEELAKIFLDYQPNLKVYFIPFSKAQVEIKSKAQPEYRVLLYRRSMLKIAEEILKKENAFAFITGESLGQVSSQTLPNIKITEEVTKIPILRPLITMDKEEIIEIAKKIGTFDVSIKPQEDCCTLFVSKHQTAKGDIKVIKNLEKKLDIKKIIRECLKGIEIKKY